MKIYSDISLIDASASISVDQNTFVLVRGSDGTIRRAPLTVNSIPMSANGNIAANLTAVITGLSSSLSGSPLFLSDAYTPRPPVSGTLFVVSGETGDNVGKNGEAYIFVTSSAQAGQWQQIFGFNFVAADARYVRLASTSSQSISSSLNITGSIYWNSGSGAVFPGAGVTASVVVLGNDNRLYITGAYGVGGSGGPGTPSAPLNSIQFNNNSAFGGSSNFTFNGSNLVNLTGSLILSGSTPLQTIGTSSFSGSLFISGAVNITSSANRLLVLDSTGLVQTVTGSLVPKSGKINAATFNSITNRSKFATASLSSSMGNTDYGVSITGVDARIWTIENKTTSSFVIDTNSIVNLTGDVYWIATPAYNPS